jgi:hypothetical protein
VAVTPAIALDSDEPSGGRVTVRGTVQPATRRVTVVAYRVLSDGRERRASARRLDASSGSFSGSVRLPGGAGAFRLVATAPADSRTAAGRSNEVDVQSP